MPLTAALSARLRARTLALGGAPLGNLFAAVAEADAVALVRHAVATGVVYFDTAPHYGNGLSERRFGAALRDVPRDGYVLSTKVGRLLVPDASAPPDQHGYVGVPRLRQRYDYSREGVLRSLAESRARLGLERIDIVYVHDLDRATHGQDFDRHFRDLLDGGLPALAELKSAGDIGACGIGVNSVDASLATLRHADLDAILLAGRYTLADQSALPELLPECARRGVAIVLGGPFNSGILATGSRPRDGAPPYFDYAPAPAAMVARVRALEIVCEKYDVPLAAAALQFPAAHPAVAVVLAGARSVAELDANLALARMPIPAMLWTELRELGLIDPRAPLPAAATSRP